MATPTQLIFKEESVDLPDTFTADPSLTFGFASVFARFDGSGAAGSFACALDLISQDEKLMARVTAKQQTLAPGDKARVTFAPFLRSAPSGSTPTPATIQWARKEDAGANQNVLSGINKAVPLVTNAANTDATIFDMALGNAIRVLVPGLFSVWARTEWTTYPGTQPDANREVWVVLNNTDVVIAGVGVSPLDDFPQAQGDIRLAANDFLNVFVHQDSGGLDVLYGGVNNENALELRYLGAVA